MCSEGHLEEVDEVDEKYRMDSLTRGVFTGWVLAPLAAELKLVHRFGSNKHVSDQIASAVPCKLARLWTGLTLHQNIHMLALWGC